jgi:hypothetical protein
MHSAHSSFYSNALGKALLMNRREITLIENAPVKANKKRKEPG